MTTATITEARLYSISQVQALTGVQPSTIRFWEKEFKDFLQPLRTDGNQRRYDDETVDAVRIIKQLIEVEGYTIEGARKQLMDDGKSSAKANGYSNVNLDQLASTVSDYLLRRMFEQLNTSKA
ncbi:MerR family transcriptional regulator [Calditrichota bacterium]